MGGILLILAVATFMDGMVFTPITCLLLIVVYSIYMGCLVRV